MNTNRNRRSTLARVIARRDYGTLAFSVASLADNHHQLNYWGKHSIRRLGVTIKLTSYSQLQDAEATIHRINRANPYERIQSRKLKAHVARMAKGWY
jgi:hypothetical protein